MVGAAPEYLEAIDKLPAGAFVRLSGIGWNEYEEILAGLATHPGWRVNYLRGSLEIMSPLPEHEDYKDVFLRLVDVIEDETDMHIETRGSTTFKRYRDDAGTEPDTCFYVGNAARVIGRQRFDADVDPPPDVVVEIDITNDSWGKFPVYALLGVPEIWRYNGREVSFYALRENDEYGAIATSLSFPFLTSEVLTGFLSQSKTAGQKATRRAFRQWLRQRLAGASFTPPQ